MSGVPGDSGVPRGRGRGRARSTEPGPDVLGQSGGGDLVGRRAAGGGRRTTQPASSAESEKPLRGSPPGEHSPTSENAKKLAGVSLISALAARPGYGTLGRKCRMFANHFEIQFKVPSMVVYRYHITISKLPLPLPESDQKPFKFNRLKNREIFYKLILDNRDQFGVESPSQVAYDGDMICFTSKPLKIPFGDVDKSVTYSGIDVVIGNRQAKAEVGILNLGELKLDLARVTSSNLIHRNSTPIQMLDILLKQYRINPYSECVNMYSPHGASIFMIPGTGNAPGAVDLGGGREIWKGLFVSAHVAEGHMGLVNMDVAHSAFYKLPTGNSNDNSHYTIIQFLCDILNAKEHHGEKVYLPSQLNSETRLLETQRAIFRKEIVGLKVRYQKASLERTTADIQVTVRGFESSALDQQFPKDGRMVSVFEHCQQNGVTLKYPKLPILRAGSLTKPQYLPIEQTCMAPADRKASIQRMVHLARFAEDPYLREFGVQINPEMSKVEGRILPAPAVTYASNQSVQPREGVWRILANKFHNAAGANGVAAISFSRPPRDARRFLDNLMEACRRFGMKMPHGSEIFCHNETRPAPNRVELAFNEVLQQMMQKNVHCDLIIAFIPEFGSPLYSDVKRIGEIVKGIMTQCVLYKTVDALSVESISNLTFKMNMKLGGVNCELTAKEEGAKYLLESPTLVLGIDVTHPGPTEKKPSVASVVGSVDLTQMRYAASIKVQKYRQETIVYLTNEIRDRMVAFFKTTQIKPERLLVFRDGVSQGQFEEVLREELESIRQACKKVDVNFRPKITFVVVQKRHHTRLFPEQPNDGVGKAKNIFPGTVVDRTIVHPDEFVYYLCSHYGIQGTSRPTRYYVLYDDSNFKADDLQMITYYLCHCFSRCTRSVSIPAPVYFADLACTRAREHLKSCFPDLLSDSATTSSGDEGASMSSPSEQDMINATTLDDKLRKEMYFT